MRATRAIVMLLAVLLAACGGGAETDSASDADSPSAESASPEAEGPGPECVETDELTASGIEWDPGCIVTSGSITITNEGQAPHTFTIPGEIDEPVDAAGTLEVDVTAVAEPDEKTLFVCTIHPGMDGWLWVQ